MICEICSLWFCDSTECAALKRRRQWNRETQRRYRQGRGKRLEVERRYRENHRDEINARRRAKRAAAQ